jgi:hypothetical protein
MAIEDLMARLPRPILGRGFKPTMLRVNAAWLVVEVRIL